MRCWLADKGYGPCEHRADGQPDQAHLIPKQRIVNAGLAMFANDPRVIVPICRHHHRRLDGYDALNKIELRYEQYPRSVYGFASEQGFWFANPRDGWRKEAA